MHINTKTVIKKDPTFWQHNNKNVKQHMHINPVEEAYKYDNQTPVALIIFNKA
jgi:hypothetical protein